MVMVHWLGSLKIGCLEGFRGSVGIIRNSGIAPKAYRIFRLVRIPSMTATQDDCFMFLGVVGHGDECPTPS